ncbi:MAG: amidohydrolase family protein [Betaproteobacteria bacterium]|nr:amidohydrolase family protein [Betaproteobacteria bacterium]
MYDGPVIDAFLHTPWLGGEDLLDPRGDRVDWSGDPRLQRVMHTFRHNAADGSPAAALDRAGLREHMTAAGVERVLLPAKIYYTATEASVVAVHRQLEELCSGSDDTMRWACSLVPPELGPGTYWDFMRNPRLLAAAAARPGLTGVHITPSPWATPPNHKWYYPAYAACVQYQLPLLAYVGMPGPLWPMDPNNPAHLEEVALAFPDLRIIAHHIGDPWVDIAIRLAARHPNFYICTSAWSPEAYPRALLDFLKGGWHGTRGCDKVVFASDFPLLDMQRSVRDLRQLEPAPSSTAASRTRMRASFLEPGR